MVFSATNENKSTMTASTPYATGNPPSSFSNSSKSTMTASTPMISSASAFLLMETSDFLLLETGDRIILDGISGDYVPATVTNLSKS